MKTKKIKIGVLGCANVATRSIIPAIIELDNEFILSGIASRMKEKAIRYAKKFHTVPFYSYQDLIDNADIDAIYIPLPNSLHAEWIEKSLNRGIHVLVEKSLACSYEEVKKLNKLAEKKDLVLIENFQFRFHPQIDVIKELIDNDTIGELRSLRSSFGFPPFPEKDNIRYKKNLGGGALFDTGAYPIKISQMILGLDLEVKAANLNRNSLYEVDIWGGAYLQQKNGLLFSEIAFGFDHYYQCNVEIWGSKGKITANRVFTAPPNFEAEIILELNSEKKTIKLPNSNHFKNMLLHFNSLIKGMGNVKDEYQQNINQARLISDLIEIAKIN